MIKNNKNQIKINNESKRNLIIQSNKTQIKLLKMPVLGGTNKKSINKINNKYLRLEQENIDLEQQNTIKKNRDKNLLQDGIKDNPFQKNAPKHDNDNKNHANDNYSLPEDLRGPSNNRWGGHKRSSLTKVKGTFGPASKVREVSPEVKKQYEDKYCKNQPIKEDSNQ